MATFFQSVTQLDGSVPIFNNSLSASVATNALTIALKTQAALDPSPGNPVAIPFRNATQTIGTYQTVNAIAATSLVIPASTTIGTSNGVTANLFVYAINNAGTVELAVSLTPYFDESNIISTSAVSGGSSTTAMYSTTSRSNVAFRLLGRIQISEATAGTWATAPTIIANVPFYTPRQFVIGTAQTTDSNTTSASLTTLSTSPQVSITANRTGVYRVNCVFSSENSGQNTNTFQITGTVGSPTVLFTQTIAYIQSVASFSYPASCYSLFQLTAGTAYTFALQAKTAGGTLTIRNSQNTNGSILLVEEL